MAQFYYYDNETLNMAAQTMEVTPSCKSVSYQSLKMDDSLGEGSVVSLSVFVFAQELLLGNMLFYCDFRKISVKWLGLLKKGHGGIESVANIGVEQVVFNIAVQYQYYIPELYKPTVSDIKHTIQLLTT